MPVVEQWLNSVDYIRRTQGLFMQSLGMGADETPHRIALTLAGARLRCYGDNAASGGSVLIVPAPIKGPYIWDLAPQRSVVRRLLHAGFAVYMVEWVRVEAQNQPGLEEYAGRLLDQCVEAVRELSPGPVVLAGHSLGGTFAALYSAWQPEKVSGLALVEAPVRFGEAAGAFKPLLDTGWDKVLEGDCVPGSMLGAIAAMAAPDAFIAERQWDFFMSLRSPEDVEFHQRVVRWTLDEFPMSHKLFDDVVEQLYRQDRFMRGRLSLGGTTIQPRRIRAPVLVVFDPSSRVIPPESVLDFFNAVEIENKKSLSYEGDTGVALQHVGPLVGRTAHQKLWPEIIRWLQDLKISEQKESGKNRQAALFDT